jgi:hypothetical protein
MNEPGVSASGGRWVTSFENLINPRPQMVLQALSPSPDDTLLNINLGVQRTVGLFWFQGFGVSSAATTRLRFGNDPTFGVTTYDSGVASGWPQDKDPMSVNTWGEFSITGQYEADEYVDLGMPRGFVPLVPVVGQYIRINIADSTAQIPAQLGCFGAFETFAPLSNIDLGWSTVFVDETDVPTTPYGSKFFISRGKRRRLNLGVSNIRQVPSQSLTSPVTDVELMQRILGWVAMTGKSRPIVISVFPDDTMNLEKRTVYGTLSDDVTITNPYFAEYQLSVTLEQLV